MKGIYITENIFFLRRARRLSRVRVYTDLKIPKRTYYDIENGISIPTLTNVVKLADYYGVSLDNLVLKKMK